MCLRFQNQNRNSFKFAGANPESEALQIPQSMPLRWMSLLPLLLLRFIIGGNIKSNYAIPFSNFNWLFWIRFGTNACAYWHTHTHSMQCKLWKILLTVLRQLTVWVMSPRSIKVVWPKNDGTHFIVERRFCGAESFCPEISLKRHGSNSIEQPTTKKTAYDVTPSEPSH